MSGGDLFSSLQATLHDPEGQTVVVRLAIARVLAADGALPARVLAVPAIGGTPSSWASRPLSSWAKRVDDDARRALGEIESVFVMGGSSLLYTGSDRTLVRFSGPRKPRRWKAGERAPWGRRKKHRDTPTHEMRREGMQAPEPRRPWPDGPGYYEQLMEFCPDWPRKRT